MVKTPNWEAKQLLEKRTKDGISAKKLAEMLGRGANKENVYKWEKGVVRPKSKGMSRKIQNYINGIEPAKKVAQKKTNGAIKKDEYKEKYYTLLEKYTALLEKK